MTGLTYMYKIIEVYKNTRRTTRLSQKLLGSEPSVDWIDVWIYYGIREAYILVEEATN